MKFNISLLEIPDLQRLYLTTTGFYGLKKNPHLIRKNTYFILTRVSKPLTDYLSHKLTLKDQISHNYENKFYPLFSHIQKMSWFILSIVYTLNNDDN